MKSFSTKYGLGILIILITFFYSTLYSQTTVLLNENFNGGSLPSGWTTSGFAGPNGNWLFRTSPNLGLTGGYAIADSYYWYHNVSSNNYNTILESPTFDASNASKVVLEYDYQYRSGSNPEFSSVDIYNGTTWVIVQYYRAFAPNYPNTNHSKIDITEISKAYPNCKIRFHYYGQNNWWFALDNFKISKTVINSNTRGPAGIEGTTGESNLMVWLQADDLNGNNNIHDDPTGFISTWVDKSGNGNNYTFSSGTPPNLIPSGPTKFAYFPNGSYLKSTHHDAYGDGHAFIISKKLNYSNATHLLGDDQYSLRSSQWFNTNKVGYTQLGITDFATSITPPYQSIALYAYQTTYSSTFVNLKINQQVASINVSDNFPGIPVDKIGNSGGSGNGNMAIYEIIVFNRNLSLAETIILENHLSAKYGDFPIQYNNYALDHPTNGNFDYHVNAFGRASDGSVKTSGLGQSIFKISAANPITNNRFFFWGESIIPDNYTFQNIGNYKKRINSKWRCQAAGYFGNINIEVPKNLINTTGIPACGSLVIVTSSDINFTTKTYIPLQENATNYSATNVSIPDGHYFTLQYSTQIALDNNVYYNGSGTANSPNNDDGCMKLFVKSNSNGTVSLSENATVLSVEVETGGVLKIDAGVTLTVNENIINNGQIILAHGAHLIQRTAGVDANSGTGTYIVSIEGNNSPYKYNIWSSPIKVADIPTVFSATNPCDIFAFDHPTQTWKYDYALNSTINCDGNNYTMTSNYLFSGADGIMDIGRGYFVPGKVANTRIFNGKINNGDLSIPVSATSLGNNTNWNNDDWNLIGNPYPSAISAKKFWAVNASSISDALYFWDDGDTTGGYNQYNDYASWNLLGGVNSGNSSRIPNGQIATGQGFWFYSSSSTNVVFNNNMRSDTAALQFKTTNLDKHLAWISFTAPEGFKNNILIGYNHQTTDGIDANFDAHKLIGNSHVRFASIIDNQEFSIQGVGPINIGSQKVIPLVVYTDSTGSHTFEMYRIENIPSNFKIYLKDDLLGLTTDLTQTEYTVSLNGNQEYLNRFELVFVNDITNSGSGTGAKGGNEGQDSTVTGITDYANSGFKFIQTENKIIISNPKGFTGNLNIYDISGKVIWKMNNFEITESIEIPIKQLSSGAYILSLTTRSESLLKRQFYVR